MTTNQFTCLLWGIFFLFLLSSCDSDEKEGNSFEAKFSIQTDPSNANFIQVTADQEGDPYEWSCDAAGSSTQSGQSAVFYLEKKGAYEITLKQKVNGKQGISTKQYTIAEDSYYHQQGESLWWNDEFTAPEVDVLSWNYDQGTGKWGNNEWQNYTNKSENSFIRDGMLVLRAMKSGEGQKIGDYTSARLTTRGKKEISRGRVEVRARLAGGVGLWPAIWFYGTKASPYYSEIDLLEYVGCDKDIIYGAIHTTATLEGDQKVSSSLKVPDVEDNFHVYGMNWTDDKIEFYLDSPDNIYLPFRPEDTSDPSVWPFDSQLYLIINIAVGGDWGGMRGVDDSIFPREMEVDYVRFFQK
ncbi:MAG: glycoside hydrolase family 16 protein [Bacteroides sp.]|nr:glycoside hydrolase family 16 protein [Bacteroides sp.]